MKTLNERTLVWAHRGASAYMPENTLESFAEAVKMKADGVELDVHFTKDRQVVVLHDEKIDRTSNGQGLVNSYTLDELRMFDFGYKFYNERRGIKIPTLDEVYELLAPTGLTVNVEIKSADPEISKACIEIAKRHKMEDKVIYSSFDHFQLERMIALNKEADMGVLYSFNMANPCKYAQNLNAAALHPSVAIVKRVDGYIKTAHENGLRVNVWTANKEDEVEYLLENKCDAVITNFPDVAYAVREKFENA